MAPPSFCKLGKQAMNIFTKGYDFGLWRLDCTTKTTSGLTFETTGTVEQESGKVSGGLETKYELKDKGITFIEKWNTDNTLDAKLFLVDKVMPGVILGFEGTFTPATQDKTWKVKCSYLQDMARIDLSVSPGEGDAFIIHGALVAKQNELVAGYHTSFDTGSGELQSHNICGGYITDDMILTISCDDFKDYNGSIFKKCSDSIDAAVQVKYSPEGEDGTTFGIGGRYILDEEQRVGVKINNSSQVGISYQQMLRPGIRLSLSTLIDGQNFANGPNKMGIALDLEA